LARSAEQTRLADQLGYTIAGSPSITSRTNCLCASPLMMIAHLRPITEKIRLGTAVVAAALYKPAAARRRGRDRRRAVEWRLSLGIGCGYQPYDSNGSGSTSKRPRNDRGILSDPRPRSAGTSSAYNGKHYQMPETHIPARPVQKPMPIYVADTRRRCSRRGAARLPVLSSGRVGRRKLLAAAICRHRAR